MNFPFQLQNVKNTGYDMVLIFSMDGAPIYPSPLADFIRAQAVFLLLVGVKQDIKHCFLQLCLPQARQMFCSDAHIEIGSKPEK